MDSKPDARPADSENRAGVDVAHDRELLQVMRLAIHIGADVQQDGGLSFLRREARWTAPAGRQPASVPTTNLRRRHHGAGISGADHSGNLAVAHQTCPQRESKSLSFGGPRSTAESSIVIDFAGVNDFDRQSRRCRAWPAARASGLPVRPERWERHIEQRPEPRRPPRQRAQWSLPMASTAILIMESRIVGLRYSSAISMTSRSL